MNLIETFCIASLLAAIFVWGEKLHSGDETHKRRALSAAEGAAVAYAVLLFFV